GEKGRIYTPNNIKAAINDTVTFMFQIKNHTVTQSAFAEPCTHLVNMTSNQSGFRSGFVPVAAMTPMGEMPSWTLRVDVSTPLWFFCEQVSHCSSGMVGAINAPDAGDKTFEAFLKSAESQGGAAPAEGGAPPAEGGAAPAEGGAAPAEGGAAPAEGGAAPAEGGAAPAEGGAPPAGGGAPPAEGGAAP
ncbi:uncharacterized protein MELLADRAFT_29106, partial [Melampsora larici-populina 98AG31]